MGKIWEKLSGFVAMIKSAPWVRFACTDGQPGCVLIITYLWIVVVSLNCGLQFVLLLSDVHSAHAFRTTVFLTSVLSLALGHFTYFFITLFIPYTTRFNNIIFAVCLHCFPFPIIVHVSLTTTRENGYFHYFIIVSIKSCIDSSLSLYCTTNHLIAKFFFYFYQRHVHNVCHRIAKCDSGQPSFLIQKYRELKPKKKK